MSGKTVLGIFLCLGSAFMLALSMSIQQYALTAPEDSKLLQHIKSRDKLWLVGLAIYLIAQLNFVAALSMGSFSLMSALFTTVLLFDAAISYVVSGKKPSKPDTIGLSIIIVAVGVCAVFGPIAQYKVTAEAVSAWASQTSGIFAMAVIGILLAFGMSSVLWFERSFPLFPEIAKEAEPTKKTLELTDSIGHTPMGNTVNPRIVLCMRVLYPLTLALFETMGAASLKAVSGMLLENTEKNLKNISCYIVVLLWFGCILSTVLWLRKVYAKFQTTECLPTEIGLTTAFSIFFGLFFYQEMHYMTNSTQRIVIIVALLSIPAGISIMVFMNKPMGPPDPGHNNMRGGGIFFPAKEVWTRSIKHILQEESVVHHLVGLAALGAGGANAAGGPGTPVAVPVPIGDVVALKFKARAKSVVVPVSDDSVEVFEDKL